MLISSMIHFLVAALYARHNQYGTSPKVRVKAFFKDE
jgi:hypothetical protein